MDKHPSASPVDMSALPANAVEVRGLAKTYRASGQTGPKLALDSVDLTIPRGELLGCSCTSWSSWLAELNLPWDMSGPAESGS